MKIQKISVYETWRPVFKQKQSKSPEISPTQENLIFGAAVTGAVAIAATAIIKKNIPDKYIKTLAKDLTNELHKEIKPSDLKSVMTKKDFYTATKNLKEENYVASPENIKNGIFRADFHSHSNFSDGKATVEEILNQAAEYGDKLNKINNKKFMFALSDHDGIEGVKEALKIIAQNPEKYKNIKFIPAAELSMPIVCDKGSAKFNQSHNDVEMVEMLIYGINPFSTASKNYFDTLYKKRETGIVESLKEASKQIPEVSFSKEEYNKYFSRKKVPYCMLNQHWRIFQYVNLKSRITQAAREQNKNPEELYNTIMDKLYKYGGFNGQALDKYFADNNIKNTTKTYIDKMENVKSEICAHLKGATLWAPYESNYLGIVEYAKNENAVLSFAHPAFTLQNMAKENMTKRVKEYIDSSDGRLLYSEAYHQAYPPNNVTKEEINETNEIIKSQGLISIGGRDAHRDNFKF